MRPRRAAVVLAALLLAGAGCGSSDDERAQRDLRPNGCALTVDVFPAPAAGVRRQVLAQHELAAFPRGEAAVDVWILECPDFALALVGVVLAGPAAPSAGPLAPKDFRHYLVRADTDSRDVADQLTEHGIPASLSAGLRVSRHGRRRSTEVPGAYAISSPLSDRRDRAHDHDNVWLHDGAELRLTANGVRDNYCAEDLCGRITVSGDGELAELLGARSARAHASLDHLRLDPVLSVLPER